MELSNQVTDTNLIYVVKYIVYIIGTLLYSDGPVLGWIQYEEGELLWEKWDLRKIHPQAGDFCWNRSWMCLPDLKIWLSLYMSGMDKVRERGAPLPGNDKENWGNHHTGIRRKKGGRRKRRGRKEKEEKSKKRSGIRKRRVGKEKEEERKKKR